MSRTEKLNESYYARRNAPTYDQFRNRYHFKDEYNREYMIASKNKQAFQNRRVQFKSTGTQEEEEKKKPKSCIRDGFGFIKLFVRVRKNKSLWFFWNDINKPITLIPISNGNNRGTRNRNRMPIEVILKSTDKPEEKSATGSIYVKGLSESLCNELLNM
jgi:hypothetical protein